MTSAARRSLAVLTAPLFLIGCHPAHPVPREGAAVPPTEAPVRRAAVPAATPSSPAPAARSPTRLVRPLFSPLLRPERPPEPNRAVSEPPVPAARKQRPAPPRIAVATPEPEEDEDPDLILVGVTQIAGQAEAVIEAEEGFTHRVRRGEELDGYQVVQITGDSVLLRRDEETRSLLLGEGKEDDGTLHLLHGAGPLKLTGPDRATLAVLPPHLLSIVNRVMPRTGELRRVRTDRQGGQVIYRVERRIDGRDWELRLSATGEILRIEQELDQAALPAPVVTAANSAVPGYRVNTEDTPRLTERGGERYYEVEVRQEGGRQEVDLRISADGRILGRG